MSLYRYIRNINKSRSHQQIAATRFAKYDQGTSFMITIMPLQDFLLPSENVKFYSNSLVRYGNKKYRVLITDKRLILYAQRGYFIKSDDIVSEGLDRIQGLEYSEKGFIFRMAKISIQCLTKLELYGPISEINPLFHSMQSLIHIGGEQF
jgi:hypothetical protein